MKKEKIEQEELFIPKTKHKFLKILLALIIIGGIGVGGYFLYQEKFSNPKSIVRKILEESNNNLNELLINEKDNSKYKVNGIVKVDVNLGKEDAKIASILKDINFQFSGEVDPNESIANIDINTKYKNEKLIDLKTYFENNITYILLDGIYDKYLKIENENNNEENIGNIKINVNDIQVLIKSLGSAFKEEITKYDFNQEKIVITIDGKDVSTLNNYLILKDNDVNKLINNIFQTMSNNSDALKAINSLTGVDGKQFLNALSSEIASASFVGTYRINFYTDNGLFNKKLISIRQEMTQYNMTTSYNIDKIEDGFIFSTNSMGLTYSIKIKKNSSNFNLNINLNMLETYANIDISMNYEKVNEITKPDISKSKKIEDLTETEKKQIEDAFKNNDALKNLFSKIQDSVPELKA